MKEKVIYVWDEVISQLEYLKSLDVHHRIFGASSHKYHREPCVSEKKIVAIEKREGFVFPPDLRSFYLEVGNGLVGPDHGMYRLNKIRFYRPNETYLDSEVLFNLCLEKQKEQPDKYRAYLPNEGRKHFEMPTNEMSGFILIGNAGCEWHNSIITSGERYGQSAIFSFMGDTYELSESFFETYSNWVKRSIKHYQLTLLLEQGMTLEEFFSMGDESFEEKQKTLEYLLPQRKYSLVLQVVNGSIQFNEHILQMWRDEHGMSMII